MNGFIRTYRRILPRDALGAGPDRGGGGKRRYAAHRARTNSPTEGAWAEAQAARIAEHMRRVQADIAARKAVTP